MLLKITNRLPLYSSRRTQAASQKRVSLLKFEPRSRSFLPNKQLMRLIGLMLLWEVFFVLEWICMRERKQGVRQNHLTIIFQPLKEGNLRCFINKENLNQKLHENLVEIVLRLVVN